ncbi:HEAT repeat domain-containing protein [Pseudomonas huaxiensis]|uniref:hypothetical protein n=1 Tax=Pseudomonas huaxiensis TaxID=2213017 RepID=UPI0013001C77|nr:hypothetical protein [Pseudomonas huaxiensis]
MLTFIFTDRLIPVASTTIFARYLNLAEPYHFQENGIFMSSAVSKIMAIYKSHTSYTEQTLKALGQAGGDAAVEAIMSIYKSHTTYKEQTLHALGEAGGEEAVKAIMSIYQSHTTYKEQTLAALGRAGRKLA